MGHCQIEKGKKLEPKAVLHFNLGSDCFAKDSLAFCKRGKWTEFDSFSTQKRPKMNCKCSFAICNGPIIKSKMPIPFCKKHKSA